MQAERKGGALYIRIRDGRMTWQESKGVNRRHLGKGRGVTDCSARC